MAGRIILGIANPALDVNAEVDSDSTLTFYQNGTTTKQAIFTDAGLGTELLNPLSCNAGGRFPQIWAPTDVLYSVKWSPDGASPITYDDVAASIGGPNAAAQILASPATVAGGVVFTGTLAGQSVLRTEAGAGVKGENAGFTLEASGDTSDTNESYIVAVGANGNDAVIKLGSLSWKCYGTLGNPYDGYFRLNACATDGAVDGVVLRGGPHNLLINGADAEMVTTPPYTIVSHAIYQGAYDGTLLSGTIYINNSFQNSNWGLGTGKGLNLGWMSDKNHGVIAGQGSSCGLSIVTHNGSAWGERLVISVTGKIGIVGDTINISAEKTPASAAATGVKGDICWDASYIYVCTATDTWKRVAIATW